MVKFISKEFAVLLQPTGWPLYWLFSVKAMQKLTFCFEIDYLFISLEQSKELPSGCKERQLKLMMTVSTSLKHNMRLKLQAVCQYSIPPYIFRALHYTLYNFRLVAESENFIPY